MRNIFRIIIIFVLFASLCFFVLFSCSYGRIGFNSEKWKKYSWGNRFTIRQEMIDDLVKNHLYIGMDKKNVEKLLGKSDYGPDQYYLGRESGIGTDSICLVIEYDKKNHISRVSTVTRGIFKQMRIPNRQPETQ